MCYARFKNKVVKIRLYDLWHTDKVLLKDYLVYSMPVVLNN